MSLKVTQAADHGRTGCRWETTMTTKKPERAKTSGASSIPALGGHREEPEEHESGFITDIERRGVRTSRVVYYSDLDFYFESLPDRSSHRRKHAELLETANRWLKESGERTLDQLRATVTSAPIGNRSRASRPSATAFNSNCGGGHSHSPLNMAFCHL
jgi:hypothetical protein